MLLLQSIYPSKNSREIELHLKIVQDIEECSVKAHALISASVGESLKSFISHINLNLFKLWTTFKEQFCNWAVNLSLNLEKFNLGWKEPSKKMVNASCCHNLSRIHALGCGPNSCCWIWTQAAWGQHTVQWCCSQWIVALGCAPG